MPKWDSLSVFLPSFNEQENLEDTVAQARKFLKNAVKDWELIIVDDGSKDKTGIIADRLAKKDIHLRVIHNRPNRGYGGALQAGYYSSKKAWIAFTDADGQFDISELNLFFANQRQTGADAVIGYYISRSVSKTVIFTSKIWEFIVFILFGLKIKDIDCGLKLLSKNIIDTIPHLEAERGAFISSELLIKTQKSGFKITEVGVHHYPRKGGKATGRNLKVIIGSFIDLFKLWWKLSWVN